MFIIEVLLHKTAIHRVRPNWYYKATI